MASASRGVEAIIDAAKRPTPSCRICLLLYAVALGDGCSEAVTLKGGEMVDLGVKGWSFSAASGNVETAIFVGCLQASVFGA